MPDLRPLLSPDSIVIIGAAADRYAARAADQAVGRPWLSRPALPGDAQPERGARAQGLRDNRRNTGSSRSGGDPGAGGARRLYPRAMRRSRRQGGGRDQLRVRRGEDRRGRQRARPSCRRSPAAPAWSSPAPIPRGWSTRCGRWSRPSARCFTTTPCRCCRQKPRQADRGQLPVGRVDLRLSVARPRPPAQIHLPGQRRQPDRAGSARLCRLGARRGRRRHLPVLSRRHPRPGPLPRRRRQGGAAPASR